MFDLHDPRNAVLPFARRHPPGEIVAVEGGVGVCAYESVFDFHSLTIIDDPGIKQALSGRNRTKGDDLSYLSQAQRCFLIDQLTGGEDDRLATSALRHWIKLPIRMAVIASTSIVVATIPCNLASTHPSPQQALFNLRLLYLLFQLNQRIWKISFQIFWYFGNSLMSSMVSI